MEIDEFGIRRQILQHLPQYRRTYTNLPERLQHCKAFQFDAVFRKAPTRCSCRQAIDPCEVMVALRFMFVVFFFFRHCLFNHEYFAADGKNLL